MEKLETFLAVSELQVNTGVLPNSEAEEVSFLTFYLEGSISPTTKDSQK